MAETGNRGPLSELNRVIKENRVVDYTSPNLALGMAPVEFGRGCSKWNWNVQPPAALNPFGTIQGGYLTLFVDELFSTAIASVLEDDEWSMTVEFKLNFLRALTPTPICGSGRVLRRTRTIAFLEAQVEAGGQIAVTASSTWAVMRR